jgi:hypothetical protein
MQMMHFHRSKPANPDCSTEAVEEHQDRVHLDHRRRGTVFVVCRFHRFFQLLIPEVNLPTSATEILKPMKPTGGLHAHTPTRAGKDQDN